MFIRAEIETYIISSSLIYDIFISRSIKYCVSSPKKKKKFQIVKVSTIHTSVICITTFKYIS